MKVKITSIVDEVKEIDNVVSCKVMEVTVAIKALVDGQEDLMIAPSTSVKRVEIDIE